MGIYKNENNSLIDVGGGTKLYLHTIHFRFMSPSELKATVGDNHWRFKYDSNKSHYFIGYIKKGLNNDWEILYNNYGKLEWADEYNEMGKTYSENKGAFNAISTVAIPFIDRQAMRTYYMQHKVFPTNAKVEDRPSANAFSNFEYYYNMLHLYKNGFHSNWSYSEPFNMSDNPQIILNLGSEDAIAEWVDTVTKL